MLLCCALNAQTVIKLNPESGGRYTIDATVNGVGVRTYYSDESWFASMSTTTYLFLTENGYIADEDIKGLTVMKMPDGSTVKAGAFVIKSLRIGNVIVRDLPAFVINKQSVPLVVGNSTFDCFGTVVVEDDRLCIYDGIEHNVTEPAVSTEAPQESLLLAAQEHIDAKEYAAALDCFETVMKSEPLGMYAEYQYIMLLNIQKRDSDVITFSKKWLAAYEGSTTYLDYWVHDAMGDSYARMNSHSAAIKSYESAVAAYYAMLNISEKELLKSDRQDNTLGITLFDLAKQYASVSSLSKSQHCFFLSSKCGNQAAIDACKKYNIKR